MIKLPAQVGILVVDDDVAIRRLMKMVLEREGYRVEQAADGLEAVLKLGLSDFDVIVLDLMMPNLDGFTFMNTIAKHDPARLQKVIVSSDKSECREVGAGQHLVRDQGRSKLHSIIAAQPVMLR